MHLELLTKSRIQHIQCHLIALLSPCNRHQPFVAAFLRLVDFDHTATEVSNLVDLRTTLANYGTNHVVGDVDLLGQWLTGHDSTNGSGRRCRTPGRWCRLGTIRRGLRADCGICGVRSGAGSGSRTVGHGWLRNRRRSGLSRHVGNTVGARCGPVGVRVMSPEGVRVTILATSRLRDVRHNLHATGNCSSRTSTPGSISGSRRSSKAFGELLDEGSADVVRGNVHGIGNTEDDKRPLSRQGEASIGGIQPRTRCFLDLANTDSTLANDRADENVGDQQTQRVSLGLGSGRGINGFIVKSTDDQSKCLKFNQHSIIRQIKKNIPC